MPKFAREERRAIVLQIQTLLTSGIPSTQVVEQVIREHGVHRVTANRYLNLAYADWNRSRNRTRKSKASFAVAVRERAMRLALTKKKFMVVDGQLLERDDPDVKAYLDAADSVAKIEGLFAPERVEIINESFAQLWRELVIVLRVHHLRE
jgi:hypothetical protein